MNFPFSRLNFSLPQLLSLFTCRLALLFGSFFSLPTLLLYYPFSPSISTSHPLIFRLAKATEGRASSQSLRRLFSPFLSSPSPLYPSTLGRGEGVRWGALAPSCLSIYPSLSSPSARLPFASFSASLFLFLSRFLSLLRIYRGEQRMWMGWVSPRLGERSITCEPKGEEIRGCAAYLQERSGAQAGMVEYCGTRAHYVPPRCSSRRPAHSSRDRLSSFPLFRPPRFPAAPLPPPSPRCSPRGPVPYVRNEPRVIHHNRFTCTSAVRTFTALVSARACPAGSNGAVFIVK